MAVALLVAAGSGERLGLQRAKAFVVVAGRPMVEWSVDAMREVEAVERIVVALPDGEEAPPGTVGVRGGASRSESVRAALAAAGPGDPVIVHDAARPLAAPELFQRALAELEDGDWDGVVAAVPVSDTVKRTGAERAVVETLDRSALWSVQTPQVFRRPVLERALDVADDVLAGATDDAWLVERNGGRIRVLPSTAENLKVTTRLDLRTAEALLAAPHPPEDTVSGSDVEVVRELLRRFSARDNEGALALFHPDLVLDTTRLGDMAMVTGVYRGADGMRHFWSEWLTVWKGLTFEYDDFQLGPAGVLVRARQRVQGRLSEARVEQENWVVYTLEKGLIRTMSLYADRDDALRAAGLA